MNPIWPFSRRPQEVKNTPSLVALSNLGEVPQSLTLPIFICTMPNRVATPRGSTR